MTITIIGLGPGPADDITRRAWRALESAETVYLRTERHPCVPDLPQGPAYHSFDALYETADSFDAVYETITQQIIDAAKTGPVAYAVPGDPQVGEATTDRIRTAANNAGIAVQIVNGVSFIEPMLAHMGIDALDGLQIIDGLTLAAMHHPPLNPQYPTLVAQVYSRDVASDIKLTLMNQYPDETSVTLIHAAGTNKATVENLPLYEIDRSDNITHLTSLVVPAGDPYSSFEAIMEVIAHLRAPEGCPWDRKQTHESLRPYLLEETYEVLEAIDAGDWDELASELGDLLLQIVLHAQIAVEDGEFYMADILERINKKMIRRHPHVWGDVDVNGSAEQVKVNWEEIKKAERAAKGDTSRKSLLDGVPRGAPGLLVAHSYQQKAAKVGFDWPDVTGVERKVREEMQEIFAAPSNEEKVREIGDLLFVLVNWLRWLGVDDPESTVRAVNQKFYRRFRYIEDHAPDTLDKLTLDDMDALWNAAKAKGL